MTYVRMFETEQKARNAVDKLQALGISDEMILLVAPGFGDLAVLRFMLGAEARVCAQGLERGRTLVLVRAAYGSGQAVIDILDDCGPVDSHLLGLAEPENPWKDTVTPVSTAFRLRVLKQNTPTPLSSWLGLPCLSNHNKPAPFSDWLGLSSLSNQGKSAPFSEMMQFPALSSSWSLDKFFSLPPLSNNAAPLSSLLGFKTLVGQEDLDLPPFMCRLQQAFKGFGKESAPVVEESVEQKKPESAPLPSQPSVPAKPVSREPEQLSGSSPAKEVKAKAQQPSKAKVSAEPRGELPAAGVEPAAVIEVGSAENTPPVADVDTPPAKV